MLVSVANAASRLASSSDRDENSGIFFSRFGSIVTPDFCIWVVRLTLTAVAGQGRPLPALQRLNFACDFTHRLLGVAEQHRGLGVVEQRVVDAGEAGGHRALEHDDG